MPRPRLDAPGILHHANISPGELRSGSRRRIFVEARGSISWIAVRELGYSGAHVARNLGVTNSCISASFYLHPGPQSARGGPGFDFPPLGAIRNIPIDTPLLAAG